MGNRSGSPRAANFLTKCCERPDVDLPQYAIPLESPIVAPTSRDNLRRLYQAEMEGSKLIEKARLLRKEKLDEARREAEEEVSRLRRALEHQVLEMQNELESEKQAIDLNTDEASEKVIAADVALAAARSDECVSFINKHVSGTIDHRVHRDLRQRGSVDLKSGGTI